MQDLTRRRGLHDATDVVLVGSSAGGLGVLLQADDWAAHIRAAAQRAPHQERSAGPKIVRLLGLLLQCSAEALLPREKLRLVEYDFLASLLIFLRLSYQIPEYSRGFR
jgi:hypothetical protein